jgi:phospholipid/cholesterol/gamma-HCH transport system permease protein
MASITRGLAGQDLTEMEALREAGALGFTDDGKPVVSAGMLRRALQYQRLCGGVLALQGGAVLVHRGLGAQVGGLVGLSMCKELAPVMMAILIAGRIGSAMAAELGSMHVYQEVDALRTLNIQPIPYLVLPRIFAIAIALPALVIFSILVGWLGGAFVASFNHDIAVPATTFFAGLREMVRTRDILHGLLKSVVFAVAIGTVCCHHGLQTRGGPRGVGRSVTKGVTNSIVLILLLDYILTRILLPFDA